MNVILPYIQIILAVLLVGAILLQQSEGGLGGAFGGADDVGSGHTRRGLEKTLFNITIIIAIFFVTSTILALIL